MQCQWSELGLHPGVKGVCYSVAQETLLKVFAVPPSAKRARTSQPLLLSRPPPRAAISQISQDGFFSSSGLSPKTLRDALPDHPIPYELEASLHPESLLTP